MNRTIVLALTLSILGGTLGMTTTAAAEVMPDNTTNAVLMNVAARDKAGDLGLGQPKRLAAAYRAEGGGGPTTVGRDGRLESAPSALHYGIHIQTPSASPHDTSKWRGGCDERINGEYDNGATPLGVVHFHVRHLIRCIFAIVSPSDTAKALVVADRESGFTPSAYNPSGCAGIFQHQIAYWTDRTLMLPRRWLAPYLWTRWSYNGGRSTVSPFSAYANVWITSFMVRGGGWGPWGG
jgi:hypothetical protein